MTAAYRKSADVVVVVNLAKASRREFLSGFFDNIPRLGDWRPKIVQTPDDFSPEAVDGWLRGGVAGIVTAEPWEGAAERVLSGSDIPVVVIGTRPNPFKGRRNHIAFLHIDDFKVGELAAEHLGSLGRFTSAAFLSGEPSELWSDMRWKGFSKEFSRRGIAPCVLRPGPSLREAVDRLAKPAAIFAASDAVAQRALEACPSLRAQIPERIALLGVDNDELVCNALRPRLSSVMPDHYREGGLAAEELHRLMHVRRAARPTTTLCCEMKVVTRESTAPLTPSSMLVERAEDFIRRNATHGISPGDVARHLGVSRRLLDLRFGELSDETVSDTIRRVKLDAVKRLLLSTDATIASISRSCGFPNANHLRNVFAAATGLSMREWRRREQPQRPCRPRQT